MIGDLHKRKDKGHQKAYKKYDSPSTLVFDGTAQYIYLAGIAQKCQEVESVQAQPQYKGRCKSYYSQEHRPQDFHPKK